LTTAAQGQGLEVSAGEGAAVEFGEAVNMTAKELERWLDTEGHDPLK